MTHHLVSIPSLVTLFLIQYITTVTNTITNTDQNLSAPGFIKNNGTNTHPNGLFF